MMKLKLLATIVLIAAVGLMAPAKAETSQPMQSNPSAQAQPTARQVLEACVQNRAETLPNPFRDVLPDHWAFKAVLTMHYCGAFRQATPPGLIDRLTGDRPPEQPPHS